MPQNKLPRYISASETLNSVPGGCRVTEAAQPGAAHKAAQRLEKKQPDRRRPRPGPASSDRRYPGPPSTVCQRPSLTIHTAPGRESPGVTVMALPAAFCTAGVKASPLRPACSAGGRGAGWAPTQ
eukprot:763662-Hanusia_phi.AAC.1